MRRSVAMRWIAPSAAVEIASSAADRANSQRINASFWWEVASFGNPLKASQ